MTEKYPKNKTLITVQNVLLDLLIIFDEICCKHQIRYWLDSGSLLGAYRHKGFIPWDDDIDVCVLAEDYKKVISLLTDFCKNNNKHILYFADMKFSYFYDYFSDISYFYNGVFPLRIDLIPVKIIENSPEAITIDKSLLEIVKLYVVGKEPDKNKILDIHKKYLPTGINLIEERSIFFDFYENYILTNKVKNCLNKDYLLTSSVSDTFVKKEKDYFHINDIFPLKKADYEGKEFNVPKNPEKYLEFLYGDYMEIPPPEKRISNVVLLNKNTIPKPIIKDFIEKFHYYGFLNYLIGEKNKGKNKKLREIKSFLQLSFYLLIRFRFKSFTNLLRYSVYKIKKK